LQQLRNGFFQPGQQLRHRFALTHQMHMTAVHHHFRRTRTGVVVGAHAPCRMPRRESTASKACGVIDRCARMADKSHRFHRSDPHFIRLKRAFSRSPPSPAWRGGIEVRGAHTRQKYRGTHRTSAGGIKIVHCDPRWQSFFPRQCLRYSRGGQQPPAGIPDQSVRRFQINFSLASGASATATRQHNPQIAGGGFIVVACLALPRIGGRMLKADPLLLPVHSQQPESFSLAHKRAWVPVSCDADVWQSMPVMRRCGKSARLRYSAMGFGVATRICFVSNPVEMYGWVFASTLGIHRR